MVMTCQPGTEESARRGGRCRRGGARTESGHSAHYALPRARRRWPQSKGAHLGASDALVERGSRSDGGTGTEPVTYALKMGCSAR